VHLSFYWRLLAIRSATSESAVPKGRKGMQFINRTFVFALASLLATGMGVAAAAPQSAAVQAGASAQSQAGANSQVGKSGAQASGSGSTSSSVSASGNAADKSAALSDGTTMNATLTHSLDAKKNKPGDSVEARTTQDVKENGKVVIPKGTRLVGHVTRAQARGAGQSESVLGVTFDRAELRNGQELSLSNATIQAVAASQNAAQATADNDAMVGGGAVSGTAGSGAAMGAATGGGLTNVAGRTAGGAVGGATANVGAISGTAGNTVGTAAGSTVNAAGRSAGAVGGLNTDGMMSANSRGIFGLDGMSLNSAASGTAEGSAIVSPTRNVHLDGGTRMLLRAQGQAR
jgi:hypothetical protein